MGLQKRQTLQLDFLEPLRGVMTDLQPQWLKQQLAAVVPSGQVKSRKDAHFKTGEHMLQLLAVCGSPLGKACFMSWETMTLASSNSAAATALSWRGFAHVNLQSCTCMCQAIGIERPPWATSECGFRNNRIPQCAHCGRQPVLSESRAIPATAASGAISGCSLKQPR